MTAILPEAQRNRLLRRVDWRFLMANPAPTKSICFTGGLLAQAIALISQQTVDGRVGVREDACDCDLGVLMNPQPAALHTAYHALRTGGVCYSEWYAPFMGGTQGVQRRVEAAGFVNVRCYWAWPWPRLGNPLFWLPVEHKGAMTYFLTHRQPPRSWRQALWRQAIDAAWRCSQYMKIVAPICTIAYKSTSTPAIGQALPSELKNWAGVDVKTELLLTGGLRTINKVIKLVFDGDDATKPAFVVKMARVSESNAALEKEAIVLEALHGWRSAALCGAPQLLFRTQNGPLVAVGESVLSGDPLWIWLRPHNFRTLALRAVDWLVELARRQMHPPDRAWYTLVAAPAVAAFIDSFGEIIEPQMWRQMQARLDAVGYLPSLCEHRDFSPWNVLLDQDENLLVVDWESAVLRGAPGMDLFYFLTYLVFFRDGAMESKHFCESYRTMLDATSVTGAVFYECVQRYAEGLGLAATDLHLLRPLVWVIHARSDYQRLWADAAALPEAAALRTSLFFRLWREEMRISYYGDS
jgi:hypothetical protein